MSASADLAVVDDGAAWAVLVRVFHFQLAVQVHVRVGVLQVKQRPTVQLVALLARPSELALHVALDLPVVRRIALALAAIARDLLPLGDWALVLGVGMQVLSRVVVLKTNEVAASKGFARAALGFCPLGLLDEPNAVVGVSAEDRGDDLLAATLAEVDVLGIEATGDT